MAAHATGVANLAARPIGSASTSPTSVASSKPATTPSVCYSPRNPTLAAPGPLLRSALLLEHGCQRSDSADALAPGRAQRGRSRGSPSLPAAPRLPRGSVATRPPRCQRGDALARALQSSMRLRSHHLATCKTCSGQHRAQPQRQAPEMLSPTVGGVGSPPT